MLCRVMEEDPPNPGRGPSEIQPLGRPSSASSAANTSMLETAYRNRPRTNAPWTNSADKEGPGFHPGRDGGGVGGDGGAGGSGGAGGAGGDGGRSAGGPLAELAGWPSCPPRPHAASNPQQSNPRQTSAHSRTVRTPRAEGSHGCRSARGELLDELGGSDGAV